MEKKKNLVPEHSEKNAARTIKSRCVFYARKGAIFIHAFSKKILGWINFEIVYLNILLFDEFADTVIISAKFVKESRARIFIHIQMINEKKIRKKYNQTIA